MGTFPVYGPDDVRKLRDYDGCIAAVRQAMARFTAEGILQPLRSIVEIVAEIGEVLLGKVRGRTSVEEITVYKSLGHIVQDLAAVSYLHGRAAKSHPALS